MQEIVGNESVINRDVFNELRSALDAGAFGEVSASFRAEADAYVAAFHQEIAAGEASSARRIAHQIAGLMSTFGADVAACTAQRLSREGSTDIAALRVAAEQLMSDIVDAMSELDMLMRAGLTSYSGGANQIHFARH